MALACLWEYRMATEKHEKDKKTSQTPVCEVFLFGPSDWI